MLLHIEKVKDHLKQKKHSPLREREIILHLLRVRETATEMIMYNTFGIE